MNRNDVLLDVQPVVADERTLGTLVSLSVRERVLGQVVLPHERLVTHVTTEVLLPVSGRVLRQRRLLREAPITDLASVRQLLRVRPVVDEELGLAHHDLVAAAAAPLLQVVVPVVLQTLEVEELVITDFARR